MSDLSLCPGHDGAPICVHCRRLASALDERWRAFIFAPTLEAGGTTCVMYVEPRSGLLERSSVWDQR